MGSAIKNNILYIYSENKSITPFEAYLSYKEKYGIDGPNGFICNDVLTLCIKIHRDIKEKAKKKNKSY